MNGYNKNGIPIRENRFYINLWFYIIFQDKLRDTEVSVSALLPEIIVSYQNAVSSMKHVMSFKIKSKQNASWWDKECSKTKYLKKIILYDILGKLIHHRL